MRDTKSSLLCHLGKITGWEFAENHPDKVEVIRRFDEGDSVLPEYAGTEKAVFARIFLQSRDDKALKQAIADIEAKVKVTDENGDNMLYKSLDAGK